MEYEGPGYFEQVLRSNNLPFHLIAIDRGDVIPQSIEQSSALVFMGGPMSVNDNLPWITQEIALIRQAREANMPVLGHCLGGQLISKALGGTVTANPVQEIGWFPVSKIPGKTTDDWLAGLPDEFMAFHWHGETFSVPEAATPLLQSEHCAHQAFAVGNILALQCHVEMTSEMVREWAQLHTAETAVTSPTVQNGEQMMEGLDIKIGELQQQAKRLYRRWLAPLTGPVNGRR